MPIALCLIQVATVRCDDVVPDLVCLAAYALKLVVIGEGDHFCRLRIASVRSNRANHSREVERICGWKIVERRMKESTPNTRGSNNVLLELRNW